MSTQAENIEVKPVSWPRWIVALVLLVAASLGNHYLPQVPAVARWVGAALLMAAAVFIMMTTAQGKAFWALLKDAEVEARKVTWPSGEETWQTTLVVLGVVVVTSFLLWGLDSIFGLIISSIIG